MKISIFGSGYVGLVTGTCLAEIGHNVICVDIDKEKIDFLNKGIMPIYEPGLKELVLKNVKKGRLFFTNDFKKAIKETEVLFIAVGTPPQDYGQVDMTYVYNVAKTIGENLDQDEKIIVNKSTVPVKTADKVKKIIQGELDKRNMNFKFSVVSNPEFLREGNAIQDFMEPDRIVIGVNEEWAKAKMEFLYKKFIQKNVEIFFMDTRSSEMTKYAANAFLSTKISFINEIANLCEIVDADVEKVRQGISTDHRIGKYFLNPGIGYGGSCFPKDILGLCDIAKKHGYTASFLEMVDLVNKKQKEVLVNKVKKKLGDLYGKKLAVWGLAFKPNTDDMREAPSIIIIKDLISSGAKVIAYDPEAMQEARKVFKDLIQYKEDKYECLDKADALLILTEWDEFKKPDFDIIKKKLKNPFIFDGRNMYDVDKMKKQGFIYIGIGRNKI